MWHEVSVKNFFDKVHFCFPVTALKLIQIKAITIMARRIVIKNTEYDCAMIGCLRFTIGYSLAHLLAL
jgi:hypothetical protein